MELIGENPLTNALPAGCVMNQQNDGEIRDV